MATLDELRKKLDATDGEIVALLNRRAELALEVKKTKEKNNISVYSPSRERQILDRVCALAGEGHFPAKAMERVFVNIISTTRSLIGDLTVSYTGPEYSLAHDAAIAQFGEAVQYRPEVGEREVFSEVEQGEAHFGVIAARTSAGSLVTKTFDLLIDSKLSIIAEIGIRERLALFSRAGSISEVKRVCSDAYYFSRSDAWLNANMLSAQRVLAATIAEGIDSLGSSENVGLIASSRMGERYDLKALAVGIENDSDLDARFLVVGEKQPPPSGNDKTSLVCAVEDRAGALRDILRPFAERGITLLKIESRSVRGRAWECSFFIDVVGHESDTHIKETIEQLREQSLFLRVLGSFPMVCQS